MFFWGIRNKMTKKFKSKDEKEGLSLNMFRLIGNKAIKKEKNEKEWVFF